MNFMAAQDQNTNQIRKSVQDAFAQANSAQSPLLTQFAAAQERRAAILQVAGDKLAAQRGENDPQVIALRQDTVSANRLKATLQTTAVRVARRPKVNSFEWMVFGHVINAQGQPAADRFVRVFDRDRKFDDLLGETTTDDQGDFAAVYHQRDFAERGENLPELYLMIYDDDGRLWYSSREHVRFNAGQAEYFEVQLGSGPLEDPPSPASTAKSASAKRQTKRKSRDP
jgi:5-hydroxyisourate hydrolase-like protein (transthyretin family)